MRRGPKNVSGSACTRLQGDTTVLFPLVSGISAGDGVRFLADVMETVAAREIANAEVTLVCYETDTAIGFGASMEYMLPPEHVAWQVGVPEESARRVEAFAGTSSRIPGGEECAATPIMRHPRDGMRVALGLGCRRRPVRPAASPRPPGPRPPLRSRAPSRSQDGQFTHETDSPP